MAEKNNTNSENSFAREPEIPEVQNELSKVATNPKQSVIILLLAFIICLGIFFKFFFNGDALFPATSPTVPTDVIKPNQETSSNLREIPKLPEAPKLEAPADLPPPPPPPLTKVELPPVPLPPEKIEAPVPVLPTTPLPPTNSEKLKTEDERQRIEAKRKSSIILIAGTPPPKTPEQIAEEASFQERGDMSCLLARGKIITAILETAINSDFGGEVRAIISRDVFSEKEKYILVPKGSKVFGNYVLGASGAYGRIAIIWNRIDLSSGYSINLDALSVDNLGRKGEQGRVDNKIKERLSNAILMSAFNIGTAAGLDKIVPPPANSQVTAGNISIATNIQSIIQANSGLGDEQNKINRICTEVLNAITDKTSNAFTSMMQACATARNPSGGTTPAQSLTTLITAATNAANTLLTTTAAASTPTQAQNASKQAFTDISDTVKDIFKQQDFKPTTSIDQGTIIKIYVNKDYKFPKKLLRKSRLLR